MHARRDRAARGRVRSGDRGAQPREASSAQEPGEQQPVGLQRASDEAERAGQVVDLVEHARRDHQIEACGREGQAVLRALHATGLQPRTAPCVGIGHLGASRLQAAPEPAVMAAEIEDLLEAAGDLARRSTISSPIMSIRKACSAKRGWARSRRRGAEVGIEDLGRGGHGRACARRLRIGQAGMDMGVGAARAIGGAVLAFALPPRCPGCGTVVEGDHRFCLECWGTLEFLGSGGCSRCGAPLVGETADGVACGACLERPPAYDGAQAAVAYGPVARTLALKLKYGRRPGVARTMARFMERLLPIDGDPLLVPVPLHRWRLWSRGYNQSMLLARALARRRGLELAPDALVRQRGTPPLRGMGPAERARTVRGAFAVPRRSGRGSPGAAWCWWTMSTRRAPPATPARGRSARAARPRCGCYVGRAWCAMTPRRVDKPSAVRNPHQA
jgi:predicted amidophosphoribosyltransferase